ncbi:MAG TPA: WD40 repeat domain-containing protein, partial [Nitrolancea sp.]
MRCRLVSLLTALFSVMLVGAGLFSLAPVPDAGASSGCGCAGDYVNPAVKAPSVAQPSGGSKSPGGTYTLSVTRTSLTVKDAKSGKTLLSLSGLTGDFQAGFSPNDSGFAVWSVDGAGGHVALYDLSSKTPSQVVWNNDYPGPFFPAFSPHGTYFLVAATANAQFTNLKVVNATSGHVSYDDQVPSNTDWGFSPDGNRLAIWTGTNNATSGDSTSTVILYDLSAGRQVWRTDGAFGAVSLAFSPHGTYFASATITNGSQADLAVVPAAASGGGENTPVYSSGSITLYAPPGKDKDKFGSAAWGFSPDKGDATFVYDAVSGQSGANVVMVNLTTRVANTFPYPNLVSGWWQFSPCGDVLGIVVQPSQTTSVDVGLYATSSGQALFTSQYNSLNVSLKATDANHVVTVDGKDYSVAKNAGSAGCDSGGGNGNGNGSGNGNGTSGNGNSNGNGNGGSGTIPCPSCYVPPVALTNLQVSSIVVASGGQLTGTVTTSAGGAISVRSSNPDAASVPAVVDAATGTTTFTIIAGTVAKDTLVTISATAGATTKYARFIVQAPCTTSTGPVSSYAIGMAPINGNGGGSGGPGGGRFNRQVIQVSVDPMVVTASSTVTGSVTLSDAVKSDTTFILSSSDPSAVSIPANVTVPSGATTATFPVTANAVSSDEFVSIDARKAGYLSLGATIAVLQAPSLTSLNLDSSSVEGGASVSGTVSLSAAGAGCQARTVTLDSSSPTVASVPVSVEIPAGATSANFTVQTTAVTTDQQVMISGSLNGATQSATLTVKAPAPPSAVSNDNFADAAPLSLPGIAIGDTTQATMEGGEPVLANSCAVLSGFALSHSVWFKLTPAQSGVLTVSTANAGTNLDSVLALYADPGAAGVSSLGTPLGCDNNGDGLQSVDNGSSDPTLYQEEHTGPDRGTMGWLPTWSSIMHVNVTAGQTYYVQLGGIGGAPAGHYVLTAEVNPALQLPNMLAGVGIAPTSVSSGGSATGTVTLSAPAPAGGIIVALSSSDATNASVPTSVVVPEGADQATFTVQTSAAAAATTVTVTASFDGAQQTADLS